MRIFHLATKADWDAAQASGAYTTSTHGVSLDDEGFIHASRADQWEGVRERYYADVEEPLVLLEIDTDLLDVPVGGGTAGAGRRGDVPAHLRAAHPSSRGQRYAAVTAGGWGSRTKSRSVGQAP